MYACCSPKFPLNSLDLSGGLLQCIALADWLAYVGMLQLVYSVWRSLRHQRLRKDDKHFSLSTECLSRLQTAM